MSIKIRFVTGNDLASRFIRLQAGVAMPFTPSHVEALTQDGKNFLGAHAEGGVALRPVGYDADQLLTLPDGSKSELIVSLLCSDEQETEFYKFAEAKLGEQYDWKAILGFVDPAHEHELNHIICSAFITQCLRACRYFPAPLVVPFHRVSPRDLFLVLSSHVEIPH
jgi:hypothetical protein